MATSRSMHRPQAECSTSTWIMQREVVQEEQAGNEGLAAYPGHTEGVVVSSGLPLLVTTSPSSSLSSSEGLIAVSSFLRQERINAGQCPSCGQLLFKRKGGLFKKDSLVPLTIAGCVERGQCLRCTSTLEAAATAGIVGGGGIPLHSTATTMAAPLSGIGPPTAVSDDSFSSHEHEAEPIHVPTSEAFAVPAYDCRNDSIIANNSPTALYSGPFNDYGERNGKGVMSWSNGDRYEGEFFNGVRHGPGALFFHDGSEYIGEWECNYMHGSGTRRFPNGDIYVGDYVDGKRSGEGRFYYANGDLYVGEWSDDVMNGMGRYYYSNGQRFEGLFRGGKRHGPGKFQRVDGSLDQFFYLNDQRQGLGVHWSRGRTKAWTCDVHGRIKKKLSMQEAILLSHEIDNSEY